ncbi:MAG: 5,10-methylenetetrahydrofolate reductase [Tepidisphaeraceae bacterium]
MEPPLFLTFKDRRDNFPLIVMNPSLAEKLSSRTPGVCLYGVVPPKQSTPPDQLEIIVEHQLARLKSLPIDGVIVYDIQDEAERVAIPRPFPFLPTLDPEIYAHEHLAALPISKIVYRRVSGDTFETFTHWLQTTKSFAKPRISVLVGAPSRRVNVTLHLNDAYALARQHAPNLLLGGIAIAERHAKNFDEHQRVLAKTKAGCTFFVTQAIYDVSSTKSLLSDYALALRETELSPLPIILTFAPCGSLKTLAFMKWLGIAFPRWLENDLRVASDPLAKSLDLCDDVFAELWDYARDKNIPVGINVESVSIRKAEIEASFELFNRLRSRMK